MQRGGDHNLRFPDLTKRRFDWQKWLGIAAVGIPLAIGALYLYRNIRAEMTPGEGDLIVNVNTATQDELETIPALGLCAGPAIYLLSYAALRVRVQRRLSRGRFIAALVFVALFPAAQAVPALAALALVAAVWTALHAYEFVRWREDRARTRALLSS